MNSRVKVIAWCLGATLVAIILADMLGAPDNITGAALSVFCAGFFLLAALGILQLKGIYVVIRRPDRRLEFVPKSDDPLSYYTWLTFLLFGAGYFMWIASQIAFGAIVFGPAK